MATYSVDVFIDTGFNSINIPYDSNVILSATQNVVNCPAIELMQARELGQIAITSNGAATYDNLKNADFCRLVRSDNAETVWYAVNDVQMTSPDVCTLFVTIDYILTAGGCSELEILDGITERHHVAVADDTFGAYTEEDPYMVPSDPLEIDIEGTGMAFNAVPGSQGKTLLSSTVDLVDMGTSQDATAYVPTNGTDNPEVSVPDIYLSDTQSVVTMLFPGVSPNPTYAPPNLTYYDPTVLAVKKGVERVRALGIESCITRQWDCSVYGTVGSTDGSGRVTNLIGQCYDYSGQTPLYEYATVKNKRVLYGELSSYVIICIASGNSAEFRPEDIVESGATCPTLTIVTDPRPDGKPYYRFKTYKGQTSNFFVNCISGMEWADVPLVYEGASGKAISQQKFITEQAIKDFSARVQTHAAEVGMNMGAVSAGAMLGAGVGAGMPGAIAGGASTLLSQTGIIEDLAQMGGMIGEMRRGYTGESEYVLNPAQKIAQQRRIERAQELQGFMLDTQVVAPQVAFPRSESIRDFIGNGVFCYRYRPSAADIAKLDKILTMYGYRHTAPLTTSMLGVRSKFSYVRAAGVSVKLKSGNRLPRWIREGIAGEFAVGVRIWKTRPDTAAYTDGSNT